MTTPAPGGKLRAIHVGLGGRGAHWLDLVAQRSDVESVAYVDASTAMLDKVRSRAAPGAQFFERLEDALGAVRADFALIASPSFLHAKQALQTLDAGLAVLIEKPFGLNLEEAAAVARRAHEVGRPAVVAENFRFFQAERTLKAFLDSGTVGPIENIVCIDRRDQSSRTQGSWVKSMPHPFLTEIGVHHFDSFRYLFGRQPVSVLAASFNPAGSDYDFEGGAHALIEFEGGLRLQYSGTFVASHYDFELLIEARNGEVTTNRSRIWWRPRGEARREIPLQPLPPGEVARYPLAGMATILNQFSDMVHGRGIAETVGDDNIWTLAMLEAALRSVEEKRRVEIAEVYPPAMRPAPAGSGGALR